MNEEDDVEFYYDSGEMPPSKHTKVPRWLIWVYIILPIWGIFTMAYYFKGSHGYLDRGYWQELQHAANTTQPFGPPGK